MDIIVSFGFLAINFKHRSTATENKGAALLAADHVFDVSERKFANGCNSSSIIRGKVLRQTSVNAPPYLVQIEVDEKRNVTSAICECIAGVAGACKHISAVVLYINREFAQSKTSSENKWKGAVASTKRAANAKYSKGKRFAEMYPPPAKKQIHESVKLPSSSEIQYTALGAILQAQEQLAEGFSLGFSQVERSDEDAELKNVISKIFELQSDLDNVFLDSHLLMNNECCEITLNKIFKCNGPEICYKTAKNKVLWMKERRYRITASRCYELFTYGQKPRSEEEWLIKLNRFINPRPFTSAAIKHGLKYEAEARTQFENVYHLKVHEVGLVVCSKMPWLAASPDGVILNNDGVPERLLEIKCPELGKTASVEEVMETKCKKYIKKETNGGYVLNKKHIYYAQVQMNLFLLGLKICSLMIYCPFDKSFKILELERDYSFFNELQSKLTEIFFCKMLHVICQEQK